MLDPWLLLPPQRPVPMRTTAPRPRPVNVDPPITDWQSWLAQERAKISNAARDRTARARATILYREAPLVTPLLPTIATESAPPAVMPLMPGESRPRW
jgi:hypothetical protein